MTNNAGLFANIGKNKSLQISTLVKRRSFTTIIIQIHFLVQ